MFRQETDIVPIISVINENLARRILRLRRVAIAASFQSAAVQSTAERFLFHRRQFSMKQKRLHTVSCIESQSSYSTSNYSQV